jgi:enoyl-CoA hydratase
MQFKNIKVSFEQKLGLIIIDRKEDKNALNIETSSEILKALQNFDQDKNITCISISGSEKFFSPGADIKELNELSAKTASDKKLFSFFDEIENIKKPIIGVVEGFALGGGMELALQCDFIIASENAKFGQPELNLGLIPGIGGTQRLKKYAGKYHANFLCLTGEVISAKQAYEMGFVSVVINNADFKNKSKEILKNISEKPLSSLVEIKKLIKFEGSLKEGLKNERDAFYKLLDSDNKKIGIKSFFEKKKPEWKN